jgi:hypothetical protein
VATSTDQVAAQQRLANQARAPLRQSPLTTRTWRQPPRSFSAPTAAPLLLNPEYARIRTAIRSGAPLVVHDCGTRFWVSLAPSLLVGAPSRRAARDPARRRPRYRPGCPTRPQPPGPRRALPWRRRTATDPGGLIPGATSAVVLDRTTADQLQAIHQQPATPARELAR